MWKNKGLEGCLKTKHYNRGGEKSHKGAIENETVKRGGVRRDSEGDGESKGNEETKKKSKFSCS